MIKGTRMIIITKNKILAVMAIIILFAVSAVTIYLIPKRKSVTAFSSYENILTSQITPANDENKEKQEQTKVSKSETNGVNIVLKYFFMLSDYNQAKKEPKPTEQAKQEETLIKSESVTIDKGLKIAKAAQFGVNVSDYIGKPLSFAIDNYSGPQVLIMHTHTTECFSDTQYIKGSPDRNLDENKNIVAVGEAAAEIFRKNGIEVYHDKTVHDYPSYNGAYKRAATTIRNDLEAYHGIKVVLDIHRDGITREDGTKVKLVTEINNMPTAQVMLVVGTNTMLQHDNWHENLKFAVNIQQKAIEMYPSLMRPIDLREERFNEQLTLGSLIIEVGSNGNTLEEAVRGGESIADVISAVLNGK